MPQSQFCSRCAIVTCRFTVSPGATGSFGSAPNVIVSLKITCGPAVRVVSTSTMWIVSRYVSPVLVIS